LGTPLCYQNSIQHGMGMDQAYRDNLFEISREVTKAAIIDRTQVQGQDQFWAGDVFGKRKKSVVSPCIQSLGPIPSVGRATYLG
jgi:hypothetical protein